VTRLWTRCRWCDEPIVMEDAHPLTRSGLCRDCRVHSWCGIALAALLLAAPTIVAIRTWWPL
jgi:hypothetical protein